MTREDILAMPAGKELDALVARRVMIWHGPTDQTTYMAPQWLDHNGTIKRNSLSWSPSTDISASWEVVERMKERGFGFVLIDSPNGKKSKVTADFANGSTRIIESAHTPQEAICKAALLAVTE